MEKEGKHVFILRSLVRPSSYTPGAARQRRIILKVCTEMLLNTKGNLFEWNVPILSENICVKKY